MAEWLLLDNADLQTPVTQCESKLPSPSAYMHKVRVNRGNLFSISAGTFAHKKTRLFIIGPTVLILFKMATNQHHGKSLKYPTNHPLTDKEIRKNK